MLRSKAIILAKLEDTYGSDPTPTSGVNAILCELPEFEVLGKELKRNFTRPYYGTLPPVNIGEGLKIVFTTDFKGGGFSGGAVIEPEISPLLQACNFTKTVPNVENFPIHYDLNSDDTQPGFDPDRVTNGGFTSNLNGWAGASWAYNSGKARHTAGATTPLTQAGTTGVVGRTEKLSLTISNRTAGSVTIKIGGQESASFTATPTSPVYLTSTTTGALIITPTSDFDGDIDLVTCQAVFSGSVTAKSVALYFYQHNILHKMLGCKGGAISITNKANEYAKIKWEFTGIYAGPADDVIPVSPTYNATLPPIFRSATFSIASPVQFQAIIESFTIDIKNEIGKRVSANASTGILEYFIKGRSVVGKCDPEVPSLATKDFWSLWQNSTNCVIACLVGSEIGNSISINGPQVTIGMPKYAERENILIYDLPLAFNPSNSGNDEISFIFD